MLQMKNVLVTGATGFIGRELVSVLVGREDISVTAGVREKSELLGTDVTQVDGLNIGPTTTWQAALQGITHVIHLAGVATESKQDGGAGSSLWNVNVEGTLNFARQAAAADVKRFIFISSIKVNGEWTEPGQPFTYDQNPTPRDSYGVSKYRAEQKLSRLADKTGMEVVTIRPPLVYGPRVKGNFRSMMSWVNKGFPLPLGAVHNLRSLVALDNLVDLVVRCIAHPAAANDIFLVSDGEDVSTAELLRRLGRVLGKPARLLPIPARCIEAGAAMLRMKPVTRRLCGNLQVDISHTCNTLGWMPPATMNEALKRTADDFLLSVSGHKRG